MDIEEDENLQNIKINYEFFNIKTKYPRKLITKTLVNHQKKFINFICFCYYYAEFESIHNNTLHELLLGDIPRINIQNKIRKRKFRI